MNEKKYPISEKFLDLHKKHQKTQLAILGPGMLYLFFLISSAMDNFQLLLFTSLTSLILIATVIMGTSKLVMKQLKNTLLILSDTQIIKQTKSYQWKIPFCDIKKITIMREKNQQIRYLKVFYQKYFMLINGYENLEEISTSIQQKVVQRNIPIKTYQTSINMLSPKMMILHLALILLVVTALFKFHEEFYENLILYFPMLAGFYLLIVEPITAKKGEQYKKIELIGSIVLIILGVALIALRFIFPE